MEFLEWDLSQQNEVSETLHKEAIKKLDLDLAQEELLACQATVTHAQAIHKIAEEHEKEWYMRQDEIPSDNEKQIQREDNPQEASSLYVMPNMYLRVVL